MKNKLSQKKKPEEQWQKIVSAGLIVYRQTKEGPKFLLLYRGRNVWDMPRGRMEIRERSLQTAFREVREETGLRKTDLKIENDFKKVYEKFPYSSKENKVFKIIIFYLAETKKSQISISKEHEGYAWFSLAEAQKHLTRFKTRGVILKKAWQFIKQRGNQQPVISFER